MSEEVNAERGSGGKLTPVQISPFDSVVDDFWLGPGVAEAGLLGENQKAAVGDQ
jgi:hypothetical protein